MRLTFLASIALLALWCLRLPTGAAGRQATLQQRLDASRRRVLRILSKPDWYRPFLEMLRQELHRKGDEADAMPTLAVPNPEPPTRRRRSAPLLSSSWLTNQPPAELTATLRMDGRLCLNVTRGLWPVQAGSSAPDAAIKADVCDTEVLLSVRLTRKGHPSFYSPVSPTVVAAAATSAPRTGSDVASGGGGGGGGGGYSRVRTRCSEENYCLFSGTCVYYAIIDMHMCSCRPGFGGTRCEKYNAPTALAALDAGRKRGVIGNGPIRTEVHPDVLSVVESTAMLLATDESIL